MTIVAMSSLLASARSKGRAVCAFNVVDESSLTAVLDAAATVNVPVIVQTSAIVARSLGPGLISAMFRERAGRSTVPTALQLDHCSELGLVSACIEAGWGAVLFDGSALDPVDNRRLTADVVAEAHRCGVAVEGELESIRGTEAGVRTVTRPPVPVEAELDFIEATGVDAFAPSIGNVHGRTDRPVRIDVKRAARLAALTDVPLVLHGGTGISGDIIHALVGAGIAKINISTDLRDAYAAALRRVTSQSGGPPDPMALRDAVCKAVRDVALTHLARASSERDRTAPPPTRIGA